MQLNYLKIKKSEIPCEKTFSIGGSEYILRFLYNDMFDFYTVTVAAADGSLAASGKLSYASRSVQFASLGWDLFPVSISEFDRETPLFARLSADNFDACLVCII